MGMAEVRRLKQLEDEIAKLHGAVVNLSLKKTLLQDVLRKKSDSLLAPRASRVRTGCLPGDRAWGMLRVVHFPGDGSLHLDQAWLGRASYADHRGSACSFTARAGSSITSGRSACTV